MSSNYQGEIGWGQARCEGWRADRSVLTISQLIPDGDKMTRQSPHEPASDEFACQRVIHELALHTDAGDYERALALFSDDAVMDRDGERFSGIDALRAAYAARPAGRITRHILANTVVRLRGPDDAEAISYVTVYRHTPARPGSDPPFPVSGPDVLGEYRDRFRRTAEGWRLVERITRTILTLK